MSLERRRDEGNRKCEIPDGSMRERDRENMNTNSEKNLPIQSDLCLTPPPPTPRQHGSVDQLAPPS